MKELLLLLCRYPFDVRNRETLSKLIREVRDWQKMAELINAHGITALAAYNIIEAGLQDEIPHDAMALLENGLRKNIVRNLWLTERWKEVNRILDNAGIRHILLKGMALEHTVYGSRGLRQMNDTDILVKPEEALKAWKLLTDHEFRYDLPKSPLHHRIMQDLSYHLPALYKEGYALEIHTSLSDHKSSGNPAGTDLFENATEININDSKALIPSQEIHLKYLIHHFNRHARAGECQVRSYADIILLSRGDHPDFSESFIPEPDQRYRPGFRKAAYKEKIRSIKPGYRFLFLLGDLFPSIRWMKRRYSCNGAMALLYYPHRLGKVWWLV